MPKSNQLICEKCGFPPSTLYVIDNWYYCMSCGESEMRRQRFMEENVLFDEIPVDNDNAMQYDTEGGKNDQGTS